MFKYLYLKIKYKIIKENNRVTVWPRFRKTMFGLPLATVRDEIAYFHQYEFYNAKELTYIVEKILKNTN